MSKSKKIKTYEAEVIKEIRRIHNLSQSEFAKKFGLTKSTVSRIEKREVGISAYKWIKICVAFNIDPNSLITGITIPRKQSA